MSRLTICLEYSIRSNILEHMSDFYDRKGKPLTLEAWTILHSHPDYKFINNDRIGNMEISTVWMGSDHSFAAKGPILIFETMIFSYTHDDPIEWDFQERYTTEDEARDGHEVAIKMVLDATRLFSNDLKN